MEIHYYGTAAAEGIPALFCECEICRKASQAGGRERRTRSQARIDGELLLDFPPDTYAHMQYQGLPVPQIESLLITHSHSDHLFAEDFWARLPDVGKLQSPRALCVYGSAAVIEKIRTSLDTTRLEQTKRLVLNEVKPFEAYLIGAHTVTPLPANHDPLSGPFIYLIQKGQTSFLYANDTGLFPDETWDWLERKRPVLAGVSLDCTMAFAPCPPEWGHLNLEGCCTVRQKLCQLGCTDASTRYILNHFSHNGLATHADLCQKAEPLGFIVAYDGMTATV